MTLNLKDLEHVLNLAHLEVTSEEKELYLEQLQHVLERMESLNALDLEGVNPTLHASERPTNLREDELKETNNLLLADNAPVWEENSFQVPKIV